MSGGSRSLRSLAVGLTATALSLAACGSDGTTDAAGTAPAASDTAPRAGTNAGTVVGGSSGGVTRPGDGSDSTAADGSSTNATSAGSSSATSGTTVASDGGLGLSSEGLEIIDGARITHLTFGTGRDEVATVLENVLGESPASSPVSPECPNQADESLEWPSEIRIDIRDDQMISWTLIDGSPLTTLTGAGLGITRADLESALVVTVEESTLGIEFATDSGAGDYAPELRGLLTGTGPDATVSDMWAGEVCAFR